MENAYELIDVGDGARLERFGPVITSRPAPSALEPRRNARAWEAADLVFSRGSGWTARTAAAPPDSWTVELDGLTLELRPTESGQVGLFPEQAPNWRWLGDRPSPGPQDGPVLNLFGYTGAATLALAAAGWSVAHVDASRPAVTWARRNAALSGLADRPVRWLVDDGEAFVAREQRRDRRYRGIVLDPPSYGHGVGGRSWRLEGRLAPLLEGCVALAGGAPEFVLLTAHTPGFGGDRLAEALGSALHRRIRDVESGDLELEARSGGKLRLGAFARWPARRGNAR